MKYLPRYFYKGQLDFMMFCFPDPHFKRSNHRRRIISVNLLSQYAYILQDGGLIFNITDVEDLYKWTVEQFELHPQFVRLSEDEIKEDSEASAVVDLITNKTDEAQRVEKAG